MSRHASILLAVVCWTGLAVSASGREWVDSTGKYSVEADLIAFSNEVAVLKKEDHSLVALPLEKLSKADRDFITSKEATESTRLSADQPQTWTFVGGKKVVGKVVDYGRKDVTIQRRRGKVYVNDRLFDNLPEVYRHMLPKIVAHFDDKIPSDDAKGLETWAANQMGRPRTFNL